MNTVCVCVCVCVCVYIHMYHVLKFIILILIYVHDCVMIKKVVMWSLFEIRLCRWAFKIHIYTRGLIDMCSVTGVLI